MAVVLDVLARDRASRELARIAENMRRLRGETVQTTTANQAANTSFANMRTQAGLLRGALVGLAGSLVAREYIGALNTFQNLDNRLRLVTDTTQEFANAQQTVIDLARTTRGDLGATGTFYGRLALAAQELELSQGRLARITEIVNKTVAISGATAQEARGGLLQFSQGLASGRLGGEELRAVLEGIPALGQAIADGLGVARGELRKLGEEGRLTPQAIINALEDMGESVDTQFGNIAPTIEQQWQVFTNELAILFGRNSAIGVAIADTIGLLSEFLQLINVGNDTQVTSLQRVLEGYNRELAELDERMNLGAELAGELSDEEQERYRVLSEELIPQVNRQLEEAIKLQEDLAEAQDAASRATQANTAANKALAQSVNDLANAYDKLPIPADFGGQGSLIGDQAFAQDDLQRVLRQQRLTAPTIPAGFGGQGVEGAEGFDIQAALDELDTQPVDDLTDSFSELQLAIREAFDGEITDQNIKRLETGLFALTDSLAGTIEESIKAGDSLSELGDRLARSIAATVASALAEFAAISSIAAIAAVFGANPGAIINAYYGRAGGLGGALHASFGRQGVPAIDSGDGVGPAVPRLHSGGIVGGGGLRLPGLASDEVPAILQTGERVIPRGGSAPRVTINLTNAERANITDPPIETRVSQAADQESLVIDIVNRQMRQPGSELNNAMSDTFGVVTRAGA